MIMATIKAYTSLEQSKKLAKILPIESADICYERREFTSNIPSTVEYNCMPTFKSNAVTYKSIPAWSLAALIGVLPTLDDRNAILCKDIRYDKWHVCYHSTATLSIIDTERYDNPVDACVEMIEKLHELNLL